MPKDRVIMARWPHEHSCRARGMEVSVAKGNSQRVFITASNSGENAPSALLISDPVSQSTGTIARVRHAFVTACIHSVRAAGSRG